MRVDSKITIELPNNFSAVILTKNQGLGKRFTKKQKNYFNFVNKTLTRTFFIQEGNSIGLLLIEINNKTFLVKHGTTKKTYIKRSQRDGFLNRYDFACTGRDTVNTAISQLNRIESGFIKKEQAAKSIKLLGKGYNRQLIKVAEKLNVSHQNNQGSYRRLFQNNIQIFRLTRL